LLRASAER
jgi:hypothetical protein